ncbi:MAG: hypothetical protein QXI16_03900 [Sulfolobaceae archaeon]
MTLDINELKQRLQKDCEERKQRAKRLFDEEGELINDKYINANDEYITIQQKPINFQLNIRNGNVELIWYKQPIKVPDHVVTDKEFMFSEYTAIEVENFISARKFTLDPNGIAEPKLDQQGTLYDLINNIERSTKRSKKNFYNYALSNNWEYFCTFTFADSETRLNKDLLASAWTVFIKTLKRKYPDIKALATYERYKKRESGFHMHCLLGACDLTLKPARDKETGLFMYTQFNYQLFNSIDWKNGFNTVVCISPDSNQMQVVNYMSKYMTKESPAPYGCKRYFRTQNLDCNVNYLGFKTPEEITDIINSLGLSMPENKRKNSMPDDKVMYFTNAEALEE